MSYRVYAFDGIEIPPYLQSGDSQDMGTGQALTSFAQLPGGGFFDNYGRRKSPQGIRPITRSGVVLAGSADEAKAALDDLRARIGVRGKLTLLFDDGSLRWQWARLQNVSTPRREQDKGNFFSYEMTWISAAQHWYGVVFPADWVWGDLSWTFGDGTAEYGTSTYTITGPGNLAVEHNGNIDATNVTVTATFRQHSTSGFTIVNYGGVGGRLEYFNGVTQVDVNDVLVIDCGERSARLHQKGTAIDITLIYGLGDYLDITTPVAHGLAVGDTIGVEGTENYDGIYTIASVLTTTWARATLEVSAPGTNEATGTIYKIVDRFDKMTIYDRSRWFVLAPGTNNLAILNTGGVDDEFLEIEIAFHDHYA